eukprot:1941646-Prymnesium_polylepis.1
MRHLLPAPRPAFARGGLTRTFTSKGGGRGREVRVRQSVNHMGGRGRVQGRALAQADPTDRKQAARLRDSQDLQGQRDKEEWAKERAERRRVAQRTEELRLEQELLDGLKGRGVDVVRYLALIEGHSGSSWFCSLLGRHPCAFCNQEHSCPVLEKAMARQ